MSATSGYQSEGSAPDSNWRRYEQAGTSSIKDPYVNAVDFRHRYAEDIANAKALGVKVFRFGVEWARIEPRKGVLDQAELAYYDDVVDHIRAAGMRPMITLDHWVYPGWVADQGALGRRRDGRGLARQRAAGGRPVQGQGRHLDHRQRADHLPAERDRATAACRRGRRRGCCRGWSTCTAGPTT